MTSFTLDAKSRKVLIEIGKLDDKIKAGIKSGFDDLGDHLIRTAENQTLNEAKHGNSYRIRDKKSGLIKIHRASKSPQSPALLTGEYVESFGAVTNSDVSMEFGNTAEHSIYLEQGTDKMEPRPGLKNSIDHSAMDTRMIFETNLNDILEK